MKHGTILDFLTEKGGKRAFYLDGRLYFFVVNNPNQNEVALPRGRANLAEYRFDQSSLLISDYVDERLVARTDIVIPFNEEITWEGDVALWKGMTTNQKRHPSNRLMRYARHKIVDVAQYMRKRNRFGTVDFRIVEDNTGVRRPIDKMGPNSSVWKALPSVVITEEILDIGMKSHAVFSYYNSLSKADTMILPMDSEFVLAGHNIFFTSAAASTKGESEML